MHIDDELDECFSEYDPKSSFALGGLGRKEQLIIDSEGKPIIDSDILWNLGNDAFDILYSHADQYDLSPAVFEIPAIQKAREDILKTADAILDELSSLHSKHKFIIFSNEPKLDFNGWLSQATWLDKVEFIYDLIREPKFLSPYANDDVVLCICALFEINNAIFALTCSSKKDPWTTGLTFSINSKVSMARGINMTRRIRSKQASNAAKARHKENHELQDQAIKFYIENKDNYKNMSEAAIAISEKIVPVRERTVYEWIRKKNKEK